jgi:protein-L-isoaspartate(D-aspartate) O-methyltransferase
MPVAVANTAQVTSVEIVPELNALAARNLAPHHFGNISLEVGDASKGWGAGQYDVIVLTGSVPVAPREFQQQLKAGGRLFAIIGDAPAMQATVYRRLANDVFETMGLFETSIAPLKNAPQPQRFVF